MSLSFCHEILRPSFCFWCVLSFRVFDQSFKHGPIFFSAPLLIEPFLICCRYTSSARRGLTLSHKKLEEIAYCVFPDLFTLSCRVERSFFAMITYCEVGARDTNLFLDTMIRLSYLSMLIFPFKAGCLHKITKKARASSCTHLNRRSESVEAMILRRRSV